METDIKAEDQWAYLEPFLPDEEWLFQSAREHGAMTRKRKIRTATQLLRLCLIWAGCQQSLTRTAAWATSSLGIRLTDEALTQRFARCGAWLSALVYAKLAERAAPPPIDWLKARRVRIIDASVVTAPGQKRGFWRLHLSLDLVRRQLDHVELTTEKGAEDLRRFTIEPGELILADRRYCQRAQLVHVIDSGADFVIRHNWNNVPLEGRQGEAFDLFGTLNSLQEATAQSIAVRIKADPKRSLAAKNVWLVVLRKSPEAAEADRQKLLKRRRDTGGRHKTIDPRTIEAAGYFMVLTTLDSEKIAPEAILELYRFRWQIELEAKRLKSLHHLKDLPAKTDPMIQTWLMAQMYMALLTEDVADAPSAFSPWGYPVCGRRNKPMACHQSGDRACAQGADGLD
jgi:hypothetical protein